MEHNLRDTAATRLGQLEALRVAQIPLPYYMDSGNVDVAQRSNGLDQLTPRRSLRGYQRGADEDRQLKWRVSKLGVALHLSYQGRSDGSSLD